MTETTEKKQLRVHRDNETVWSLDTSKISFEEMQTLVRGVFNYSESPPEIFRLNNVFFTSLDVDSWLILRQAYHRIQWVR